MTAIIDYDIGNPNSIRNMLRCLDVDSVITSNPQEIRNADRLIIPGVGRFDEGMKNLCEKNLDSLIVNEAHSGKPVLGICLGMQLLGNRSEEGKREGLGLVDFDSVKFRFEESDHHKIPHMGWERVTVKESPLTRGMDDQQRFYFVHSYHALCRNKDTAIIMCNYGYMFAAAVRSGNVYGVQFHPEKSHRFGMRILKNFSEID